MNLVHKSLKNIRQDLNLLELLPIKESDDELAQRVFPSRLVRVGDHGVVGLVVVAQLQVVREQNVAQGGLKFKLECKLANAIISEIIKQFSA